MCIGGPVFVNTPPLKEVSVDCLVTDYFVPCGGALDLQRSGVNRAASPSRLAAVAQPYVKERV